ncbi:MAG TPA: hypothetical protein VH325_18475 [Bryobacteraceae bacterium]|nr:hypothetical protein [Bryobacteraceae bacterium]
MLPKCAPLLCTIPRLSAVRLSSVVPEALSPLEVVGTFERMGGKPFQVEHVPEETLRAQFGGATDPMQKSFAGLMLAYAQGDAIDMTAVTSRFGLSLMNVTEYARKVLARQEVICSATTRANGISRTTANSL